MEEAAGHQVVQIASDHTSPPAMTAQAEVLVCDAERPAACSSSSAATGQTAAVESYVVPARGLTFDEALERYVGGFGRGQLINFCTCCLVWLPGAVLILLLVFSVGR
jgi:hypothetical protein